MSDGPPDGKAAFRNALAPQLEVALSGLSSVRTLTPFAVRLFATLWLPSATKS
jgi:hypothetical protein